MSKYECVSNRDIESLTLVVHIKSFRPDIGESMYSFRKVLVCAESLPFEPLTARELEVLYQVAVGKTNLEIAQELIIVEKTVESHLRHIFGKLGVSNRTLAAVLALLYGLISISIEL